MTIHSSLRLAAIACLAVWGLAATEHHGQVKFGALPLPGATVTATQGDKKAVAVTDTQGIYTFADLADGVWTLQVEMQCFTPLKREVAVAPDAPAAEWDMKMQSFDEIKASAPAPAPAPAATAAAPTAGASAPQGGAAGAPAASSTSATTASAAKPTAKGKGKNAPAAGAKPQSGYQRADVNASEGAAAAAPDSGNSMAADASQGASEAMVVNGSTSNGVERRAFGNARRGPGSLFNGNVTATESNSALNARAFSLTGQDTAQPAYNNATFGGQFGGPLWIPHVLRRNGQFYIGYQGSRNRNASTNSTLMPTAQERAGDFSQAVNAAGQAVTIYDPASGAPFPGNVIPRIDPQAAALLKYYPQPNFLANSRYNFQIPLVTHSQSDGVQGRVNRMLNTKNYVNAMVAYQKSSGSNPNLFGFVDTSDSSGMTSNASWRHTFGKMLFGNFNYSFSRSSSRSTPYFSGLKNVSGDAGITGNDQSPGDWGPPRLSFSSGIAGLTDGTLSLTRNQTQSLGGNVTWIRRPHNITFGADLRLMQFNNLGQQNPRGAFSFTGGVTQLLSNGVAVAGTGFDFADFLLGVPDTVSIAYGNADKYLRQRAYDLYVNDDFRAASTLTLNVGLRWDYNSPLTEKYGRLVNLDVAPGFTAAAPVVGNSPSGSVTHQSYPDSLLRPDKHAIQPRIGLAWHPFLASSMLIRAGYGINYDTSGYSSIASQMVQQSPLSKSLSVANTAANPLKLADAFHAPAGALTNTFGVDPNFLIGYAQSWQISVQQDIPWSMVMTATYLGIKGTRAVQSFLPNTYPAGVTNPCATCQAGYTYVTSNGNSTRESGMLQLRRRFHGGFSASATYTYSKSIDDAALGGRGQGTSVIAQNWLDLSGERGLSPFDQRHLLAAQMQYSTGAGARGGMFLSGWRAAIVKGWTITSNINTGSGLPLTPMYSQTVAGTGVVGPIRPMYTGQDVYNAPAGHFLNPAAYAAPPAGSWGNAGRNTIVGPSRFSLDGSMSRNFSTLDLRIDATNALNHVVYTSWVTNISSSQFGLPNAPGNSMRSLRVTLRWRF